jgi:TolB protein
MIAIKKAFVVFFTILLVPALAAAQSTAPTPINDTAKRTDTTKKPVFTLHTISMSPVYIFEMNDNAKINAEHQFPGARPLPDSCYYSGERHLKNIRQLTFEGTNTRASLSPDDRYLVFQSHGIKPNSCDQIYRMPLLGGIPAERISSGEGRATGPAFLAGNMIIFSSTQAINGGACPEGEKKYIDGSDFYIADSSGKNVKALTNDPHYFNGEPTVSPNGKSIVFTSTRTGEARIFSMRPDATEVKRLSHDNGFDASYSTNEKEIVFCESSPKNPSAAEIYIMNSDGSKATQITHLGGRNASPRWTPDGEHIIFSSNYLDPTGRATDLFMIKKDGTDLERITFGGGFNGFPIFTHDGKRLVFSSSRNASHPNDVNIFAADWDQ